MYPMLLMTSQCAMQLKETLQRSRVATLLVSSPSTSGWPASAFAAAVDMDTPAVFAARRQTREQRTTRHPDDGPTSMGAGNGREGAGVLSLMAGLCRSRLCLRSLPNACIHMSRGLPKRGSHTGPWPECSVRQLQASRLVGHTCTLQGAP